MEFVSAHPGEGRSRYPRCPQKDPDARGQADELHWPHKGPASSIVCAGCPENCRLRIAPEAPGRPPEPPAAPLLSDRNLLRNLHRSLTQPAKARRESRQTHNAAHNPCLFGQDHLAPERVLLRPLLPPPSR